MKIWGRPGCVLLCSPRAPRINSDNVHFSAAAAHPPWTLKWSDDHTPSEAGLFRYREDQSTPGEYRLDLSSMVRTIEEVLHAKPGREILACEVCCDLIGPGQDRMYIDAYRRTHNPADRTTRGPVFMALHLCKRSARSPLAGRLPRLTTDCSRCDSPSGIVSGKSTKSIWS